MKDRRLWPVLAGMAMMILAIGFTAEAGACDALGQQQCVQQLQDDYGFQQLQSGHQVQRLVQPVYVQRVVAPQRQRVYVQQQRLQQPQRLKVQRQRVQRNVLPPAEETIELRNGFLGLGSRTIIRRRF